MIVKYFKIHVTVPYCGCDTTEYCQIMGLDEATIEKDIRNFAYEICMDNAEQYEYLVEKDFDESDYDSEEDATIAYEEMIEEYYDFCEYEWEEITKEEYEENGGE